jgi:carbon monoxide dehydrogenase subunit G
MPIQVPVELAYEFDVNAAAKEVFGVLADVPTSASFYPKLDKLTDLGDGAYRWEMDKIGIGPVTLQTVYASKYVSNRGKGTITWTPIQGEGNALVSGDWLVVDNKTSTHLELHVKGTLSLPLPELMKMVVAPVANAEFERLTEQYIDNLIKRFGGEI